MHKIVIADVVAKVVYLILVIGAITLNLGLIGIIGATVIDAAIVFLILFTFSKKMVKIKLAYDFAIWRKIFKFTWPLALTIALNLIYFKGDIVIMSIYLDQSVVGLYGAPYRILEVLINIIYVFLGLILPLLTAAAAVKNMARFKNIIQSVYDVVILITLPMIAGGFLLGVPIMTLFAGPEFASSGLLFKILILATAAIFIAALFGYAVVALNAQRQMIKFYAVNAVVSLAAYIYFIPIYGAWASAWITVASELFILLTAWYVLHRRITFIPQFKTTAKAIVGSAIMAGVLMNLPNWPVLGLIAIGTAVYVIAIVLMRAIPRQLLIELLKKQS